MSNASDPPTLVLLHGLGATPGVWSDVLDLLDWPGTVRNLALAGHGRAGDTADYSVGALAAHVGSRCTDEDAIVVGHSLGGCVALCLASNFFRPQVRAVVGVGLKLVWSDDDVAHMARVASKGVRWFDTRDEAVARFLLQAGLHEIADGTHPAVADGVVEVDGRWRVAQDPASFAQRPVDGHGLMAAAQCPVILGAGENDAMVSRHDMDQLVPDPRIAFGCGHNVQVEDPAWFVELIREAADL